MNSLILFRDMQSYTFLKATEYKEPENQCSINFFYICADVTTAAILNLQKIIAFQCVIAPFALCKLPYIYSEIALAHNKMVHDS